MLRRLLGFCIGSVVRLWSATWRVRLLLASTEAVDCGPVVFAFWHGQQMGLLAARRRALAVLVSLSRDGELQAGAMAALGLWVVRGSTSRAGATGLRALVRSARGGFDLAFAVDGPRGPRGRAKRGAALAARRTEARLIPVASAARRRLVLVRAWDRFEIPLPFARVVVVTGPELESGRALADPALLSDAIDACRKRAEAELAVSRGKSTPCPSPP